MKTNVYITVDTESSMGGAWAADALRPVPAERRIFCKIGGIDHGIGWQCDELERRGMKATFFCEVLSTLVLGDGDTRSYLDFLLGRGQDVQLHAHPNFYYYSQYMAAREQGAAFDHSKRSDSMASHSGERQRELLAAACGIFERLTGRRPSAYRAGGYSANSQTLGILEELGFVLDSSFNPRYQGHGSFDGETLTSNAAQKIGAIWEMPVTVAIEDLPDPRKSSSLMPFEISALSLSEMRRMLDDLHAAGAAHVVIVFHSFSAVKAADDQYSAMRPDRIVRGRFRGLLDYLAGQTNRFTVSTFDELSRNLDQLRPGASPEVPRLGYVRPLCRKVVQAVNRAYWL